MKVLVSGCGGYVGNVLVRELLSQGYEVRGVDNFHKGNCDSLLDIVSHPNFEFMYGDVTVISDIEKMYDGVDGVIHLAAIVGFPACKRQPALSHAVNVDGTNNMLKYRPYDIPFVFASTGSIYGKIDDVCHENSPCNPQSEYGEQKLKADIMVRNYDNAVALRFSTAFGVSACMRVNLLVNDLVYQAVQNRIINVFQPDFRRSFIHIHDMARSFIHFLNKIERGENQHKVYNCGHKDLNWTKRQVAEFIKEHTNCYVHYEDFGKDLDQRDYEIDFTRLHDAGFTCNKSMEEGMLELINVAPILQIRHQYE